MFRHEAGSPEALAAAQRMKDGLERKRLEREAEARARLGPGATQEEVEEAAKSALRAQRESARLNTMAKKQAAEAIRLTKVAEAATKSRKAAPPPAPPPTYQPPPPYQPPPAYQAPPLPEAPPAEPASPLYNHPIFGSSVRPGAVQSVELHRLQSNRPEHNGPGVSPGYLDTWDFDGFSQDAVRARHGGGRFRGYAIDATGRKAAHGDFEVAGRAKPLEDNDPVPTGGYGRPMLGAAFQTEPAHLGAQPPDPLYYEFDQRMRRLEDLVVQALPPKPDTAVAATPEDKFERWKKEREAEDAIAERKHERRLAEIRLQMEADAAKRAAEAKAQVDAVTAAQNGTNKLMESIVLSSSNQANTLMTAMLAQRNDGGKQDQIAPLISAMATIMKTSNEQTTGLFSLVKEVMRGDSEPKSATETILGFVEKRFDKMGDEVLQAFLMQIVARMGAPKTGAQPLQIPQGATFQLPDGRVVPPEVCAEFVAKYRARHGVDPSMEVCVQAFTAYMNAGQQQAQQVAQAPQQSQQQQVAQAHAEAQEMIRMAGQKAAEKATAEGRSAPECQAAAQAAMQAMANHINQQIMAAKMGAAQPPQPPSPPAPQVASGVPVAAPPVAPQQVAQPQPQPVAAVAPVVPEAPPQDVVSVAWMSRGFPQDAVDAFSGVRGGVRMDPIDFLDWTQKSGRISADAKLAIGRLYEDAEESESVASILTKVYTLLSGRGVVFPDSFMTVFQGTPGGAEWLDDLLCACTYTTTEEARKAFAEQGAA